MDFKTKMDRLVGKSAIVLIFIWSIIEFIFPFIKQIFSSEFLIITRGLILCVFFVMIFFYEEEDDIPPNTLETACGIILIVGTAVSAARIIQGHAIIGLISWFVIFFCVVYLLMKRNKKLP